MDGTEIKEMIGWVLGLLATSVLTLFIGILNIIKAGRMMPKEVRGKDLENRSKEVSIADQYDELATKAAEKAVKMQERLDKLEIDYDSLKEKLELQDITISNQTKTIDEQNKRLDFQERKIKEQEGEIIILRCELDNSRIYNEALIKQMKKENIIPIEVSSLPIKRCGEKGTKLKGNEDEK